MMYVEHEALSVKKMKLQRSDHFKIKYINFKFESDVNEYISSF